MCPDLLNNPRAEGSASAAVFLEDTCRTFMRVTLSGLLPSLNASSLWSGFNSLGNRGMP